MPPGFVDVDRVVVDVAGEMVPEVLSDRCQSEKAPVDGGRASRRGVAVGAEKVAALGVVVRHGRRERLQRNEEVGCLVPEAGVAIDGRASYGSRNGGPSGS